MKRFVALVAASVLLSAGESPGYFVGPLMIRENDEIASAAITVIGSDNPYLMDDRAQYWLATVGSAEVRGLARWIPK